MKRVRGADPPNGNPTLVKALAERANLVLRPGDYAVTGIVHRGQLHPLGEVLREVLRNIIGTHRHRDHGAWRRLMHQASTQRHRFDRSFEVEHPGQGGRDVFAGAVSDIRPGAHTVSVDQPRQRVFHREQCRLRTVNALQVRRGSAKHLGVQVDTHLSAESRGAGVEVFGEDGLVVVEPLGHSDVLSALTGKQENGAV